MSLSNRESFKDEQSMCYHYHFHCYCYCYCYLRSEDTGSLWMSTASTILTSTLPLPMNLPPLRSGFKNCDYDEKVDVIKFQVFLPRFGHSMVSGLFEPIGHKKWPLKFHFHDFQEFVLGDDGRAYQNELRVRFASHNLIFVFFVITTMFIIIISFVVGLLSLASGRVYSCPALPTS